ncbi:MAG TPA: carboxylesterase family protein, partial [Bryobacteraceae bacterium]|nr:carboxylesterase family protein [Bryobacteraceae bacterium]
MMHRAGFCLIGGLFAACVFAQGTAPLAISSGRITGKDLGDVEEWLGIPYAAPPVGELRWKPPRPPASWEGVRAMEQYGYACMQPKLLTAGQLLPTSEDCLNLNVWAPKHAERAAVMFWIHGGAFVEGSGALGVYAGTAL